MELATLGRAAVPPAPTPIREGRTRLEKCYVSFAIILPSDAMQKLRIVRALDEAFGMLLDSLSVSNCFWACDLHSPIISDGRVRELANKLEDYLGVHLSHVDDLEIIDRSRSD